MKMINRLLVDRWRYNFVLIFFTHIDFIINLIRTSTIGKFIGK